MDKTSLLRASNISKSFSTGDTVIKVLEKLDIEIFREEKLFIIGASGAGKSTLLHILGTLERPDEGSLILNEEDILSANATKLARIRNRQIGFVFQFHHLLDEFNALENVCLPGFVYNRDWKSVREKGIQLLDYVGLKDRLKHKPNQLSGGEQQRVAIARALINDPDLVFMDEPTGDLDEKNSLILMEFVQKLASEKKQTVVIVTHNIALCSFADRIFELKQGSLHAIK